MRVLAVVLFLAAIVTISTALVCCVDGNADVDFGIEVPDDHRFECLYFALRANIYGLDINSGVPLGGRGFEFSGCAIAGQCAEPHDGCIDAGLNRPLEDYSDSEPANLCGNGYQIVRTWYSFGNCNGNGAISQGQTITVSDTTPPYLGVPSDMTLECPTQRPVLTESYLRDNFGSPDAYDLCTYLDSSYVTENPSLNGNTLTRAFSVNDGCAATTGTQTVQFADTTPPRIQHRPAVRATCNTIPAAVAPQASDSCFLSGAITPTYTDEIVAGECPGRFTINRIWTATDAARNENTEIEVINVVDNDPPVVTAPSGAGPNPGFVHLVNCVSDIDVTLYTQVDACSGVDQSQVPFEVEASHVKDQLSVDLIVTYTSEDRCGNKFQWVEIWRVFNFFSVNIGISGPTSAVVKGFPFNIAFQVTPASDSDLCPQAGTLVVDVGYAQLSGGSECSQAGFGVVLCPLSSSTNNVVLTLTVPVTYLPDSLLIGASYRATAAVPAVDIGQYLINLF